MESNKKTMLISGIIGIGIGLFISGIILSFLLYNVNKKNVPSITDSEQINKDDLKEELEVVKSKPKNTTINPQVEPIKEIEIDKKEKTTNIEPEIASIEPEITNIDSEIVELEINQAATATEIAHLLEKNGVISNANKFISYIISKNATKILRQGTTIFEKNSSYETALEILMSYQ